MAKDDSPKYAIRRDLSGGMNTRQNENIISDTQVTLLQNAEIAVAGERSMRKGNTLSKDLSNDFGTGAFGFEPEGGTNELLVTEDTSLHGCTNPAGTGTDTYTEHKGDFTADKQTTIVRALESDEGDVAIVSNGTDNCFRMKQDHTMQDLGDTNTSPPLTTVMEYYRDRLWALDGEKLMYSGAVPVDYSATFVRDTNYYSIPIGDPKFLIGTRNYGIIVGGSSSIYVLNPTVVPDPAADKPDKMVEYGCVAGNTAKQVADDFLYLSYDGVRGLFRTINDELQSGDSKPLSWNLEKELGEINWTYAHLADAVYFDNKYMITLPTGSSTVNNKIWVFYPAYQAWAVITGMSIGRFATVKIGNAERLCGIDAADGSVYRMFYGTSDNGSAIVYQEEGRAEDFGEPLRNKQGGEVKIKAINRGSEAVITPYADIDNAGYVQLDGSSLTIEAGGLDFNFDFPFNFDAVRGSEQWHIDNLGSFKQFKLKLLCNTKDAEVTILENQIITFVEEYQNED